MRKTGLLVYLGAITGGVVSGGLGGIIVGSLAGKLLEDSLV